MARIERSVVELYGLTWAAAQNPVDREVFMIRNGGRWKVQGVEVGNGLFFHFKRFQELIWPEEKMWHRWNILELENYLNHRIIGEIGPASSGKTNSAATNLLADYYCFPECTTGLVSSTEREMLEMRVWGEIKKFHRIAQDRHPSLPGILMESRQRIITDERLSEFDGRDFRNGLCFTGETLVDTPNGTRRMDSLKRGDGVMTAVGPGIITKTFEQYSDCLVRVHLDDGRTLDCTPDHPFATRRGWIKAIDLGITDMVLSVYDTMRLLRYPDSNEYHLLFGQMSPVQNVSNLPETGGGRLSKSKVLLGNVPSQRNGNQMRTMQNKVSTLESEEALAGLLQKKVLQYGMLREVGGATQGIDKKDNCCLQGVRKTDAFSPPRPAILFCKMPGKAKSSSVSSMRRSVHFHPYVQHARKNTVLWMEMQAEIHRHKNCQQENESHAGGITGMEGVSGSLFSFPYPNGIENQPPTLVSGGHSFSEVETGRGDRRWDTQNPGETKVGHAAHEKIGGSWVVRVEILEPRGDPRFDTGKGGYRVHNISVEGHPSYSVNGIIVHNCGVPCKKGGEYIGLGSFAGIKNKRVRLVADEASLMPQIYVEAISNLNKNPDFKCVALGNPKSTTDALGRICEPSDKLGGWDCGIDQTGKTKTWNTRFDEGVCIQLVGSDSPNADGQLGIDLITRKQIEADIRFYGEDSLQFTMMNEGRMPRGEGSRRVITRQMCQKFHAMDPVIWSGSPIIKIGFLDAAYGNTGGDRCIFGELNCGKDIRGKQTIMLVEILLVPVSVKNKEDTPEDQITTFVRQQCEQRDIPPQHMFYDAGMRTTLVMSFSRTWSPMVQSIDSMGPPTERPVDSTLFIMEDGKKRLKTCREHYSKFVTETWFSVRYVIEADQFRGMTEDVMQEGCSREWGMVMGNKIEVEPKKKMKERMGRSPDLFDGLSYGVEGARRLGFQIARLENPIINKQESTWKKDFLERKARLRRSYELTYS